MYRVTKCYGHERGLSCVFRQPKAGSHCRLLHGYALAFEFTFQAAVLDERNWVYDFGGLKPLEDWLKQMFDHTCVIAADDPSFSEFEHLHTIGLIDLRVVPRVGCESFAEMAFVKAAELVHSSTSHRVSVISCKVSEHGANSATFLS